MSGSFPDRRNNLVRRREVRYELEQPLSDCSRLVGLAKMRKSHGERPIGRRVVGVVLERATAPHHGFLELLQ